MSGWTHEEAKNHTIVERLYERCAVYAGGTCPELVENKEDYCERCLAVLYIAKLKREILSLNQEMEEMWDGQ